jgi:hypothetical protein
MVVATLTERGRKQNNYQRGRLSIIAWYLQAESLSDFFLSLINNTSEFIFVERII